MSLTTLLALASLATICSSQALALPESGLPKADHHLMMPGRGPGAGKDRYWSKPAKLSATRDTSRTIDPSITGISLGTIEWSPDTIPDRNLLVTTVLILEDIYNTRPNASEIVTTPYVYTSGPDDLSPNFTALNISAVGRGREAGLPITFDNAALVMCMSFLGQVTPRPRELGSDGRTYRWFRFQYGISWRWEGEDRYDDVAEGNFTALPYIPF
ncbi:MAG: hypothetical protein Q9208_007331 [Pyrenodesmia sp. 3 TL-2023]